MAIGGAALRTSTFAVATRAAKTHASPTLRAPPETISIFAWMAFSMVNGVPGVIWMRPELPDKPVVWSQRRTRTVPPAGLKLPDASDRSSVRLGTGVGGPAVLTPVTFAIMPA